MAKSELTAVVEPKCQRLADELGYELVDVALDKEDSGKYLRIYIDKPEGIDLNDCEKYHRAIQPQLESYDYDFLEISSPGIDRPLKKDRDFERALGMEVELRLFKAVDGQKEFSGELWGMTRTMSPCSSPARKRPSPARPRPSSSPSWIWTASRTSTWAIRART